MPPPIAVGTPGSHLGTLNYLCSSAIAAMVTDVCAAILRSRGGCWESALSQARKRWECVSLGAHLVGGFVVLYFFVYLRFTTCTRVGRATPAIFVFMRSAVFPVGTIGDRARVGTK